MALVTREVNQQDHTRMLQLVKEFPEIPDDVVQNTLLKNKGNLQLTRQALEAVSEHYLYQGNQVSSPTSPQSPSRYPLHASHYSTPGSPNRSRTPSTGTPGTPPMMDPFAKDYVLSTSGRNSPSPRTSQYQNVSNQPKPGQYTNIGSSPQHVNYVSQLHVTMDRQLSRPPSRPSSGADQDGQLINGTNSASSSTGTPTGGTPTRTPTTDMPAPQFTTPPSGSGGAYNVIDDFPTENMLSITPTGPIDRVVTVDRGGPNERRVSPADIRYSADRNYGRYPVPHTPTSPYQRHPIDRYPYPVERWNGPEHHPRDMSGGVGIPIDPRSSHQYHPHPSPHLQQHSLHISQSVPNLEGHLHYSQYMPREQTQMLRNASSTHNIAMDHDRPLTPAEVHTPEVAISSHVIPPTPHSPARPVSHVQQRPHSESYDHRGPYMDGTQSLLVFPPDRREPKTNERPIPVTAWSSPKDTCISLPPCVAHEDDEYTQALVLHQRARCEKLLRDLNDERHKLNQYRRQVADMETDLAHKSTRRSPFPTAEQVNKLREEKRQLQIDIECMNREIELHKSQGLVSQAQHNNFYANMSSTGPSGPMPPKLPSQPGHMVSPQQLHPSPALEADDGQQWSCSSCTFLNHPALDKCECCEMPRI